jgi:hypothetical protein
MSWSSSTSGTSSQQRNLRDLTAGAAHAEVGHTALHHHGAALLGVPS